MAHKGHVFSSKNRRSLPQCLREILPASFWKEAHQRFAAFDAQRTRWHLPVLWHAGVLMALNPAAQQQDRFDCARDAVTALFPKRRRSGTTLSGFNAASAHLPLDFFAAVRRRLRSALHEYHVRPGQIGRWDAYGLDGSKIEVCRTVAHEEYFGISTKGTKDGSGTAQCQVVAAVGLGKHVLCDWASDSALGSERALALGLIWRLPPEALAVVDAGFTGYEWAQEVIRSGHHFLARVGANVNLWIETLPNAERHDCEVWLWPDRVRNKGGAPLVLRLIRLERPSRKKGRKPEVIWLVTDVRDPQALTRHEAARFYAKRWPASECTFRSWKDALDARKLDSRTPHLAEREMEFLLCAFMLLQVSVHWARHQKQTRRGVSVAQAQRVWRKALRKLAEGHGYKTFRDYLAGCRLDSYRRRRPKACRPWPARKEHTAATAPKLRRLKKQFKGIGLNRLAEAACCPI